MSRRKLIVFLPVAVLLGSAAFLAWVLHTESGVRWAWARAVSAAPGELQAESVSGGVRAGMLVQGLRFRNEGVVIEVPTVRMKLDFDLFPPAMSIEQFDADRLLIQTQPTATAGRDQPLAESLPQTLAALAMPFPVSFSESRIGELRVIDAEQQILFTATELTLSGRLYSTLQVSRASVRAAGGDWLVNGEIGLNAPFAMNLDATARMDKIDQQGATWPALDARVSFKGNLDQLEVDGQLREPAVKLQGGISSLLDQPNLDISLSAEALPWPLDAAAPDVLLRDIGLRISGGFEDYQLKSTANLHVIDLPEMAVELGGRGNLTELAIESLQATGETVELTATGTVAWGESFTVTLDTLIERLAADLWLADWPRDQPLHGRVSLEWASESVHFSGLDLVAGTSGFTISGSGKLDPERDLIEAELAWSGFHWPLVANAGAQSGNRAVDFRSKQGKLSLSGSPSDWRASGAMHLQAGAWPDGRVSLLAAGDSESARVEIEQGEALGGSFAGNLDFRWSGVQTWSTELRLQNLDLSAFGNALPEAIGGELRAEGQMEPLAFDVNLNSIRGRLRGQPLAANGGITYAGNDLQARDLDIRSGNSTLSLDGNPELPEGLRFSAHIEDLGELLPDAGGSMDGRGLLSVDETRPRLELEASGSGLFFGAWRIGSLRITGAEPVADEQAPGEQSLRLDIADLELGDRKLQEISITTAGTNLFDRISLHARRDATVWDITLRGDASDWPALVASAWQSPAGKAPAGSWQGQIESWRIEEKELGWLQLEAPAPLSFRADALSLGPACLRGPREGRICLDAMLEDQGTTQANARLEGISVSVLSLLTHSKIEFTQTLTGDVHWDRAQQKKAEATVSIDISPGEIRFPENDIPLVTGAGRFAFRISEGQLLAGELDFGIPEAGTVDTNFSVPDISRGADSPVEGHIRIALRDIGPVLAWVPQLDKAGGTLEADVILAGSLAEPRFTGHAALVHGYAEHQATGTVLRDIQLAGAVYQFNHTELNGSFTAGEGQGRLKANLRFDEFFQPDITLDLAGQNLTLLNVPDLQVIADPALELHWHDSRLKLNGEILIPRARLSPRYIPTGTVSESADLVIVAGAPPPEEKSAFDRSRLRLNGTVGVELGNDVSVTLDRATAKLSGKTVFNWNDSLVPIANGHYTVRGRISAYGQLLEVTEGRISFPNIPADNPHLNIRAEREIYGNMQVRKAGVLLSGTVRQPTLDTYTTPQTTAERALTLLVTGHDFDYEQGVGGVEVGMYIAPKLYVSYGIGLFENQSVISARYEIKGGFGIKATSGQRETGADVSYTIEN